MDQEAVEEEEEEEEKWEQPSISNDEHINILRLLRSLCRASRNYLAFWNRAGGARSLFLLIKPPLNGFAVPLSQQLQMELILGLRGLSAVLAFENRTIQGASPVKPWLHPEIHACLRLEVCKIVASEAPGTPIRCQAEVRARPSMMLQVSHGQVCCD